jgi:hypothetical protein
LCISNRRVFVGRPHSSISWDVSVDSVHATSLTEKLIARAHAVAVLSQPRAHLMYVFGQNDLQTGFVYTFNATIRNFLGGMASGWHTLNKTAMPNPRLYVSGPPVLRVRRSAPLNLFSEVSLSSCWAKNSSVLYRWSISNAEDPYVDQCKLLESIFGDDTFVECDGYCVPRTECRVPDLSAYRVAHNTHTTKDLHVVPDSLPAGTTLTFTVRAMIAANRSLLQSTASVTVIVEHSDLVAVIAGGSRSVPTADNFTLDASGSFDPDDRALELRDLQFYWHCFRFVGLTERNCSNVAEFTVAVATKSPQLSLRGSYFGLGQQLHFNVTVVRRMNPSLGLSIEFARARQSNRTAAPGKATSIGITLSIVHAYAPVVSVWSLPSSEYFRTVHPSAHIALEGDINAKTLQEQVISREHVAFSHSAIVSSWVVIQGSLRLPLQDYASVVDGKPRLTLPSGILASGQQYTFRLIATSNYTTNLTQAGDTEAVQGFADLTINVGFAPRCGSLRVWEEANGAMQEVAAFSNTTGGPAWADIYVSAVNWVDIDDPARPLLYDFEFAYGCTQPTLAMLVKRSYSNFQSLRIPLGTMHQPLAH